MIEFGSDYHLCGENYIRESSCNFLDDKRLYACGRHAFAALILHNKWKRIWIPAYFCYEVIDYIKTLHIDVRLYNDFPRNDNSIETIEQLSFEDGDVLLRVNYFGFENPTIQLKLSVPIIEDHTLGLNSFWALNSTADWCIASLRKSLPIAMGGALWSPKGYTLPPLINVTNEFNSLVTDRYAAMQLKSLYLEDKFHHKDVFRSLYIQTEQQIETLDISGLDSKSLQIIERMDVEKWLSIKKRNWDVACECLKMYDLLSLDVEEPFSIVIKCKSEEERDNLKMYLVGRNIYPAILWQMPDGDDFSEACDFSKRMLSIHCDARYSEDDIKYVCNQIVNFYDSNL